MSIGLAVLSILLVVLGLLIIFYADYGERRLLPKVKKPDPPCKCGRAEWTKPEWSRFHRVYTAQCRVCADVIFLGNRFPLRPLPPPELGQREGAA